MKKIACFFGFFLLFSEELICEEGLKKATFDFNTALTFPNGRFDTFGKAKSSFLELFSGLESDKFPEFAQIKKSPEIKFNLKSFGLRFSPVLYKDKKTWEKCLSFYFGKLNYSSNFKKLNGNNFSTPSFTLPKIDVKKNGNLSLSQSGFKSDFGLEFVLKHFEVNYVASKNEKLKGFDHAVFLNFNGRDIPNIYGDVYVSAYTGFSTSSLSTTEEKKYNSLLGSSLVYANEYFGLQGDFATSINTKKDTGFSGAFSIQNFYEHFNLRLGTSINSKNFIGWQNTFPKNTISFFAIPEISFDIFTLQAFYNLERSGLARRENIIKGVENLEHRAGSKIKLENKYFQLLTALEYARKKIGLESKLVFYFPKLDWFSKLEGRFTCDLSPKTINPFVMEKYKGEIKFSFLPVKNFWLNFNYSLTQNLASKKKKINGKFLPVLEWQALTHQIETKLKYKLQGDYASNTFSLNIKVFNKEPFYNIALEYALRF